MVASSPAPSPAPRRISTPSWFDLRLVLGVVLVIGAVLLGAALVSRADDTHPAVAARHDLAAGTILRSADLTVSKVKLPDDGRGVYLDAVDDAVGKRLDRPVSGGELVPAAAITRVRAATTVTVPFAAGSAPDLRSGQRIEVWVSTPTCASVVLLPDVTVQDVRADTSGSLGSGGDGQDVVINVAPSQAGRVIAALAIDQAQIRAGVLVGSSTVEPVPTPSNYPTDGADGRLPTDLAACAGASGSR